MYYINRQGGARSCSLCVEAMKLWHCCITHSITPIALYMPGKDSVLADALNRQFPHDHEWEINWSIIHNRFRKWGYPMVDLFATHSNLKCPLYCSRAGIGPGSPGDAFAIPWDFPLVYTFPPIPLMQ